MVSHTNSWFSIYTFCLKYVLGGIIFVLLLTSTQLNCIYVLNLDNMGLAISKNNHESKNVHMINSDKTILSIPHNATNILDTKSNHHSNTTTSNDKLVILTFGDTIKT